MANMSKVKIPMPEQDPKIRNRNFREVTLGYTEEMAVEEANRCIGCKNPLCVQGCPVNVRIPEFIKKIQERDFKTAYEIIPLDRGVEDWKSTFTLTENEYAQAQRSYERTMSIVGKGLEQAQATLAARPTPADEE